MNSHTIVVALVTEAFISVLQDIDPGPSLAARAKKAIRLTDQLTPEELSAIFSEACA